MTVFQFPRSPNKVHPEEPSAVGSRNSIVQEGRDKVAESKLVLDETADKILNHIETKLPAEVLEQFDIMGGLKEKLYNYVNQSYVNMFNRYSVTMEDEIIKKVRDFVDKEESKGLARYTPRELIELIDKIGGADKFNTGEIEKSVINMYGHLHGHIQRGVNELENDTNATLRQKTDIGAFIRGQNAYAILKCIFKDNLLRPKYVYDVKLSVNVLDSELISPMKHYQTTLESILKSSIQSHIHNLIDKQIEDLKMELVDQGKKELEGSEITFEKIKKIDSFTDDNKEEEKSKRYTILAKKFLDKIEGLRAEIDEAEYDPLNIRENIKFIIDEENIRNRGYNTCINSLTSILDTNKMGYQVCDNMKNARICHIREYEEMDSAVLPDERYSIRLAYYDQDQLKEEKKEYDKQMDTFNREITKVWEIVHKYYESKKRFRSLKDFDDLAGRLMPKQWRMEAREEEADSGVLWNELGDMYPENTFVEKNNRTYEFRKLHFIRKIRYLRDIIKNMHGHQNPIERVIIDERLDFIEQRFHEFTYKVNPHHIQAGLIVDIDITTTKRKQYMLKAMAGMLNEFLFEISKGFADAAFASFSRRRSTVRDDIGQSFSEDEVQENIFETAYKAQDGELKGTVDLTPTKSKKKGKGKTSGLKEL